MARLTKRQKREYQQREIKKFARLAAVRIWVAEPGTRTRRMFWYNQNVFFPALAKRVIFSMAQRLAAPVAIATTRFNAED